MAAVTAANGWLLDLGDDDIPAHLKQPLV